jgi:cob(I)alamin adenosyltransferase
MREFRIYGEIGTNPDTTNFRNFLKEVEQKINSDVQIVESSKKCNIEFANKIKEMLENEENNLFIGSMIKKLQSETLRYSYIKHLEHNGKEYEAEIDELTRKFWLHEV